MAKFRVRVRNGKRVNLDGINSEELSSLSSFGRYDFNQERLIGLMAYTDIKAVFT